MNEYASAIVSGVPAKLGQVRVALIDSFHCIVPAVSLSPNDPGTRVTWTSVADLTQRSGVDASASSNSARSLRSDLSKFQRIQSRTCHGCVFPFGMQPGLTSISAPDHQSAS